MTLFLLLLLSVQYVVVGRLRDPGAWAPTDELDLPEPVALGVRATGERRLRTGVERPLHGARNVDL